MAQAIQAVTNTQNAPFGVSSWASIAGCYISALTGSGSLIVTFCATILNTYQGQNYASLRVDIDGIPMDLTQRDATLSQDDRLIVTHRAILKLGSGQHTFQLRGLATNTDVTIYYARASLILEEPGY